MAKTDKYLNILYKLCRLVVMFRTYLKYKDGTYCFKEAVRFELDDMEKELLAMILEEERKIENKKKKRGDK